MVRKVPMGRGLGIVLLGVLAMCNCTAVGCDSTVVIDRVQYSTKSAYSYGETDVIMQTGILGVSEAIYYAASMDTTNTVLSKVSSTGSFQWVKALTPFQISHEAIVLKNDETEIIIIDEANNTSTNIMAISTSTGGLNSYTSISELITAGAGTTPVTFRTQLAISPDDTQIFFTSTNTTTELASICRLTLTDTWVECVSILAQKRIDTLLLLSALDILTIGRDEISSKAWIVNTQWGTTPSNWKVLRYCDSPPCLIGDAKAIVDGELVHTLVSIGEPYLIILASYNASTGALSGSRYQSPSGHERIFDVRIANSTIYLIKVTMNHILFKFFYTIFKSFGSTDFLRTNII